VKPSPQSVRALRRSGRAEGAFTLLEILLAMAIIALMAAVLIGGAGRLLNDRPMTVDEVFFKAVMEARKGALTHERNVYLRYVGDDRDKGKLFVVVDGEEKKEFPIPPQAITPDFAVDFLSTQKGGNLVMVGGVVLETMPITAVTFYSDGTCQPFRLQVMRNGAAGITAIDPWTCAPVLTPPDPNAPKM
jgi:prepilin-type N-terminal cleavage/methylation domain-containing protein